MKQLTLLREILGSNSHNIKTESRVRTFYKVAHGELTELDGDQAGQLAVRLIDIADLRDGLE